VGDGYAKHHNSKQGRYGKFAPMTRVKSDSERAYPGDQKTQDAKPRKRPRSGDRGHAFELGVGFRRQSGGYEYLVQISVNIRIAWVEQPRAFIVQNRESGLARTCKGIGEVVESGRGVPCLRWGRRHRNSLGLCWLSWYGLGLCVARSEHGKRED
jgi:hypothetical protein